MTYLIEGTAFTYEQWAEACVNMQTYDAWDKVGRSIPDYELVFVLMTQDDAGFRALIRGVIDADLSLLFEVKYDRESRRTAITEYAPTNHFVKIH